MGDVIANNLRRWHERSEYRVMRRIRSKGHKTAMANGCSSRLVGT